MTDHYNRHEYEANEKKKKKSVSREETEAKVAEDAVMGEQQLATRVHELEAENKTLLAKLTRAQRSLKSVMNA